MDVRNELEQLANDLLSQDPRSALVACRTLERDLLPWLTDRAALQARRTGWAWERIGNLLGISRQAAHSRFSAKELGPPHLAPRQPTWGDPVGDQMVIEMQRDRAHRADLAQWESTEIDIVPW